MKGTEAEAAPSPHESGGAQTPCGAQGTVVALCDRGKLCCWPAEASPSGTSGPKPLEIELGGSARIICIEDVGRGRVAAVSECALSRSHLATIHIVDVATGKLLDSSSALDQLSSTILCCASPAPGVVALGTDCGLRFWRERDPARGQWGLVHRTAYSTVGGDIPSNHHLHEALRATTAEFVCAIAAARVPGGRAALATGSGDGTVGLVFPGTGDGEWAHVRDWSARSGADALFRRVRVGRCHDRVCGVADLGRGRLLTADITNTLRVWHCGSGPGAPGSSGAAAPGLLRVLSLDVHRHGADNELESGLLTSSRDGRVAITVGSKCDVQLWRWDHAAETLKQDRAAPTGQSATGIFVAAAPRPPLRPGLGGGGDGPHSEPSSSSAAAAPAPSPGLAVFVGCESGCVERWDVQPGGQSGVLSRIYRPATRTGPVFGVLQMGATHGEELADPRPHRSGSGGQVSPSESAEGASQAKAPADARRDSQEPACGTGEQRPDRLVAGGGGGFAWGSSSSVAQLALPTMAVCAGVAVVGVALRLAARGGRGGGGGGGGDADTRGVLRGLFGLIVSPLARLLQAAV